LNDRYARQAMRLHSVATACAMWALCAPAHAMNFETDNPDLKLRWDTTVGYSLGIRTAKPSPTLTQGPGAMNFNDGDLNFAKRRRPIANRLDLFTEADVSYRGFGARVSAAAWYDAAYMGGTSNTSGLAVYPSPPAPSPFGPFSAANTLNSGSAGEFTQATKDLHGRKAELLDAFVFGKFNLGSVPLNVRLGKHALLWGESLFFGFNSIAGGMAPIDIVKAQSSPNATIKEIVRPVGQLSGQLQITPDVSVGAYYQYDWQKSRLPASGSYYSTNDTIDAGGERLYIPQVVNTPGGPLAIYLPATRGSDQKAPNSGQYGVQSHFRVPGSDIDFGLYAIQFSAKLPVAYLGFSPTPGVLPSYRLVYAEKIKAFGASFNTTLGPVNLGGEASIRTNAPLTRGLVATTGGPGPFDASGNPAYPVGHTAHVNLSTITTVPSNFIAREASLAAEVAWNRVLSCTLNCDNIAPGPQNPFGYTPRDGNANRDAWGLRMVYTPTYRQALTGIDLSVPVGLSYSPRGRSGALGPAFVDHGGDMSIGLSANVRETFTLAANFTHYYGSAKPQNNASGFFTFGQSLRDRDNVTLSARVSF
jgi:Protein of unknown function (DUF1302)